MNLNILPLRQLTGAVVPFDFSADLSDLELYGEYPIPEPAHVSGQAENRADLFLLHMHAEYTVHTACARCLKPLTIPETLEIERVLVDSVEDEEKLGEEEIVLIENDAADLDAVLREAVIWSAQMSYLCREDCLGLCPRCGKDLNDGPCGCKPEIDDRFAALADIKFE